MATKYLDSNGLLYVWQKIRNTFVSDVSWDSTNHKIVKKKKTGSGGAEQSTDIVTLATVATSGSYNDLSNKPTIPTLKNVFGKVKVGSTTIEADTTQDTLELVAGSNITLTPDASNDKVTIAGSAGSFCAVYGSTTFAQISSAIASGQSVYLVFENTSSYLDDLVGVLSETNQSSHTFSIIHFENGSGYVLTLVVCDNNDDWGVDGMSPASTAVATTSADGLMSSTDKTKLNGIASGAEVNVQSDWTQATNTADDYIKNKPTLGTASAKDTVSSISSDSNNVPTVTAVKNYVTTAVTGAVAFQGTAPTTFAPTNYKAGWYWVVGTAGTYAEQTCEAGDMIFATADGTTYSASNFDVVQTNLDITQITNAEIDTIIAS